MYVLLLIPSRTSTIEILDILPLLPRLDSHSDTNLEEGRQKLHCQADFRVRIVPILSHVY